MDVFDICTSSPRAGSCGVLCGTKWYIIGGGSRKKRHAETLVFDVLKHEWSVAFTSPLYSITMNKGFSLALVQHKERDFLIAFGGCRKDPSNQVEVLVLEKNEHLSANPAPVNKAAGKPPHSLTSSTTLASHINVVAPPCPSDFVAQRNFAHGSYQCCSSMWSKMRRRRT